MICKSKFVICRHFILAVVLLFFLSSCGGGNQSKKFLLNITTNINKKCGINSGDIVAKYELTGKINKKLFGLNYAKAINNSADNQKFITNFSKEYKNLDQLEKNAKLKIDKLISHLLLIEDKHKIFPSGFVKYLESKKIAINSGDSHTNHINHKNNLHILKHIDQYAKVTPIFYPLDKFQITSKFGKRSRPNSKNSQFHKGIDLAGAKNSLIYSGGDGIIEEIGRAQGYGNMIVIRHNKNLKTRYAHLNKIFVQEGQDVIAGQKLGLQGATGVATGDHLHYEVIVRHEPVDPFDFLSASIN